MTTISEHELTRAMHEAADRFEFPVDRIVTGAVAEGGRLRRVAGRRRAVRIVSAAGGLAAVAVVGAVVVGSAIDGPSGTGLGPAVRPADIAVPATHGFGVPADQTAQTLARLLPDGESSGLVNDHSTAAPAAAPIELPGGGTLSSVESGAEADSPYRSGRLLFDDGHGAAQVDVMIQAPDLKAEPSVAAVDIGSALCHQDGIACSTVRGGILVTRSVIAEYGGSRSGDAGATVLSSGAVYQSAGWEVTVTAYNALAEKNGAVTRETPVLTPSQLGAIATYAGWLE